jgi:hypothetical protein
MKKAVAALVLLVVGGWIYLDRVEAARKAPTLQDRVTQLEKRIEALEQRLNPPAPAGKARGVIVQPAWIREDHPRRKHVPPE